MAEDLTLKIIFEGDVSRLREQLREFERTPLRVPLSAGDVQRGGSAGSSAAGSFSRAIDRSDQNAEADRQQRAQAQHVDSQRAAWLLESRASEDRQRSSGDAIPVVARRALGPYGYGGGGGGGFPPTINIPNAWGGGMPMLRGATPLATIPGGSGFGGGGGGGGGFIPPIIDVPGAAGGGGAGGGGFWNRLGAIGRTNIPWHVWRVGGIAIGALAGAESARINLENTLGANYNGIQGEYDARMQYADRLNAFTLGIGGIVDYYTGNRRGAAMDAMGAAAEQDRRFAARWASRDRADLDRARAVGLSTDPNARVEATAEEFKVWQAQLWREGSREVERINQLPLSQAERQAMLNQDNRDRRNEEAARIALTNAQIQQIQRNAAAESIGLDYATRSMNAAGINPYQSGLLAIQGNYAAQIKANEQNPARVKELQDAQRAAEGAYNRADERQQAVFGVQAAGATAANYARAGNDSITAGFIGAGTSAVGRLVGTEDPRNRPAAAAQGLSEIIDNVATTARQLRYQSEDVQGSTAANQRLLNRDPLGAEIQRIEDRRNAALRVIPDSPAATLLTGGLNVRLRAAINQNADSDEDVARMNRGDQRSAISRGLQTRTDQLRSLLDRDQYGANIAGITGRGFQEQEDLRNRGFGRNIQRHSLENTLDELRLGRQQYGDAFRGTQIDTRTTDLSNPRDAEDPSRVYSEFNRGIQTLKDAIDKLGDD